MQAVGADDVAARALLDDEMVADLVERVGIAASRVAGFEALVQLHVEDEEAQRLRGVQVGAATREADGVALGEAAASEHAGAEGGGSGLGKGGGHGWEDAEARLRGVNRKIFAQTSIAVMAAVETANSLNPIRVADAARGGKDDNCNFAATGA